MIPFYFILYALFVLVSALALPFHSKLREALVGRWSVSRRVKAWRSGVANPPAWFHVASSGEFEQCIPVLEELRRRAPEIPVFVSFFSPTAARAIRLEAARRREAGQTCPWDASDYAPFDFPWTVKSFVDALGPRAFVAVHREVWPGIMRACAKRNIPKMLIATSFRRAPGWILQRWLDRFDFIGTANEQTTRWLLRKVQSPEVATLGDPRVERVVNRKQLRREFPWGSYFEGNVVLLASIWPQDIAELSTSLEGLLKSGSARLVLAPHEPHSDFVLRLEQWFRDLGHEVRRWSVWKENPDLVSHIVVDRVGELAELYRIATVAFVGGSFKARVHNVLEPAAYAKPVITGPFIENSFEAVEMNELGALIKIDGGDLFQEKVLEILRSPTYRAQLAERLSNYIETRRGAQVRYVERILSAPPSLSPLFV